MFWIGLLIFAILLACIFVAERVLHALERNKKERYRIEREKRERQKKRREARRRLDEIALAEQQATREREEAILVHLGDLQRTLYQRLFRGSPHPDEAKAIAQELAELKRLQEWHHREYASVLDEWQIVEDDQALTQLADKFGELIRS